MPFFRYSTATVIATLLSVIPVWGADTAASAAPASRPATRPSADLVPMNILPQSGNAGRKLGEDMECMLEPHRVSSVGSPVEGTLAEVLVDRGDIVRRGQVVARLNSGVEAATVALRSAQEEFGHRKVARNDELFRKELISASDKDELETQTRIATLEHKQQREVLALRTIVSPFNGVVVERFLSPGERVANEKILKIAQIDPLNVEVVVPVDLFGKLKVGSMGQVSFAPLLDGVHAARITVVDRVVDAASGTFGVRLEMPNPGHRVPAGIKCKVRFQPG